MQRRVTLPTMLNVVYYIVVFEPSDQTDRGQFFGNDPTRSVSFFKAPLALNFNVDFHCGHLEFEILAFKGH